MGKIRFLLLSLFGCFIALIATVLEPGTIIHRFLIMVMCGVLSFDNMACSVDLSKSSNRVLATSPDAIERVIKDSYEGLIGQRSREFDDDIPPETNQQTPPVPSNTRPNGREFDGSNQTVTSPSREFQYENTKIKEIRDKVYEVTKISPNGCQVIRVLNASVIPPYTESIKLSSANFNTCKIKPYLFSLQPDGKLTEILFSTGEILKIDLFSSEIARVTFQETNGQKKTIEVPYTRKNKQLESKISKVITNGKYKRSSTQNIMDKSGLNQLHAGAGDSIIGEVACNICKQFKQVWDMYFGKHPFDYASGSNMDDVLQIISSIRTSGFGINVISHIINNIGGSLPDIEKAITGTTDLGVDCNKGILSYTGTTFKCDKKDEPEPTPTPTPNYCSNPSAIPSRTSAQPKEGCTCVYSVVTFLPAGLSPTKQDVCSRLGGFRVPCGTSDLELQAQNQLTAQGTHLGVLNGTAQIEATECQPPPPKQCNSCGDPHLTTLDGQKYDHHAVGEFVFTRTKDRQFEIQVREAPYKSTKAAINSAAAMKVGNSRVGIYSAGFPDKDKKIPLWIDGQPVNLQGSQNLSGGGTITLTGANHWTVQWPTGEVASFKISEVSGSKLVDISVGTPESDRNQLEGLLGNFNGNPSDDFMTRDGRIIEQNQEAMNTARSVLNNFDINKWIPISLDPLTESFLNSLHRQFGDSWRISSSESLFDYPPGKNTDSFTNRAFPNGFVILRMLAPDAVQKAEQACRQAQVPNDQLEGCLFDVAVTEDTGFAGIAGNLIKNEIQRRVEQQIPNNIPIPIPKFP